MTPPTPSPGQELARRLSDALLKIRPLGGSEMFMRVGEDYYADPDYCGKLIEELRNDLHDARKSEVLIRREIAAALSRARMCRCICLRLDQPDNGVSLDG